MQQQCWNSFVTQLLYKGELVWMRERRNRGRICPLLLPQLLKQEQQLTLRSWELKLIFLDIIKKKTVSMRYCIIFVTCYIGSCLYVASDLQKEIISKGRLYGILSFFRSRGKNVILLILGLLRIKVSSAPSFVRCEPFYPVHLPKWNCRTPAFSQERCPCR